MSTKRAKSVNVPMIDFFYDWKKNKKKLKRSKRGRYCTSAVGVKHREMPN